MRITAWTALFLTVVIVSTSVAAADNARLADLPTGEVWIFEPASETPPRDRNTGAVLAIPPGTVMPDGQNAAPAEFNFNITLTLRRNDRRSVHAWRHRHAAQSVHRGPRHKFRPAEYRR